MDMVNYVAELLNGNFGQHLVTFNILLFCTKYILKQCIFLQVFSLTDVSQVAIYNHRII